MAIDVDLRGLPVQKLEKEEEKPSTIEFPLDKNYKVIEVDLDVIYEDYPLLQKSGIFNTVIKKLDIVRCDSDDARIKFNSQNADSIPIDVGDKFYGFAIREIYLSTKTTVSSGKIIFLVRW